MSHGVPRAKRGEVKESEEGKIAAYRALVSEVQAQRTAKDYTPAALLLTERLLRENPEFYTIWNYRREILLSGIFPTISPSTDPTSALSHLTYELQTLTLPLLIKYPKCYWIWNHRLWTLSNFPLTEEQRKTAYSMEKKLVTSMLDRDERNFHGWMYRRMVLGKEGRRLEEELGYVEKMLGRSMRNYSAWFERGQLLPRALEERGAKGEERKDILAQELEKMEDLLNTRPMDQSLWFYYRWLVWSNTVSLDSSAIAPYLPHSIRISILREEKEAVLRVLKNVQATGQYATAGKYVLKMLVTINKFIGEVVEGGDVGKAPEGYWEDEEDEEEEEEDEPAPSREEELKEVTAWLEELKTLDPARRGRYKDWEKQLFAA